MTIQDDVRNYRDNFDREGEGYVNYHRSSEETEINFVRIEPGEGIPYPFNEEQEGRYYQAVIHGVYKGQERYFTTSLFGSAGEAMSAAVGLMGEYSDDDGASIDSFDIQIIDTEF